MAVTTVFEAARRSVICCLRGDQIIAQRIAGRSTCAIAKMAGRSVAEINAAIDRWSEQAIDDKIRKNTLPLDLSRLDELQETFYRRALEGDAQSGLLVTKIIEGRGVMLGLHTCPLAVFRYRDVCKMRSE